MRRAERRHLQVAAVSTPFLSSGRRAWNVEKSGVSYAVAPSDRQGRVLAIGGSDSGAGAGIQADVKTVMAMGGFAVTAITNITVQNTLGVESIHPIPAHVVEAQAWSVLSDIGADIVKTGMLGDGPTIEAAARVIERSGLRAVVDPVLAAKDGSPLQDPDALAVLRRRLISGAWLLTPNAPEAAILSGRPVETIDDLRSAGKALLGLGCQAVLMKGGHLPGAVVVDLLLTAHAEIRFDHVRLETRHTHGTGCTLASACAVGLAMGLELEDAVTQARVYVYEAILGAPGLGRGQGPLDHGWPLRRAWPQVKTVGGAP